MKVIVLIIAFITIVVSETSYGVFIENNITRARRQANCGFKCKSGECVDEDSECDGIVNCKDGSDETDSCQRIRCPTYLFRCKYGACINPNFECDGKKDCKDNSDETTPRCKKPSQPSNCGKDQFACQSGQCISEDNKCDGIADCDDASDETKDVCSRLPCPGYTYMCNYGACVNGRARCNGKKECYDGSDEANCPSPDKPIVTKPTTSTPRPPPGPVVTVGPPPDAGSCLLPPHPENGQWTVQIQLQGLQPRFQPGDAVSSGTILKSECRKGFVLEDGAADFSYCLNGQWNVNIPNCLKVCEPIYTSSATTLITCTRDGVEVNCSRATSGTVATAKCVEFYEDRNLEFNNLRSCYDGSWDYSAPNCRPACGKKYVKSQTLSINGTKVKRGNYPWQIAIYQIKNNNKKRFICGGSLIDFKVIMTAAHCVTVQGTSEPLPKEKFLVVAGKYYSDFDHTDEKFAQVAELENIFVPEQYRGENQNYVADIAILVTKTVFKLTPSVQFICLTPDDEKFLQQGTTGIVIGWGVESPDSENAATQLNEIEIPFISTQKCFEDLPQDYNKFLTYDKICGGYLNKSKGVCKGDSGSALVFRDSQNDRYFPIGIVSVSPQAGDSCDIQQYALYTKVSRHYSWIERIRRRFLITFSSL